MIHQTILDTVGRTPLIQINHVTGDLHCRLLGKCELFNPGGSIKDRIALAMVKRAEDEGRIQTGDTLIEATSGNTGIGLALAGAVRGYKVIIVMPEKMSQEKQVVIEALGATIVRTPTEAPSDSPESHISVAKKLQQELPRAHILDQYSNPANPDIHAETTAREILEDSGDRLRMVVASVGTGGTISGIARHIKATKPDVTIVGVDPIGSILGGGSEVLPYEVEGIGYDFFPDVLDNSLVDQYIKTNDQDSFQVARRLIREEGLLIGGSSGAAVWAAHQAAVHLTENDDCVVILPDSIRNYLSKFVSNNWMNEHGFTLEENSHTIAE